MTSQLKPCPCCGKEYAEVISEYEEYCDQWGEEFEESDLTTSDYKAVICNTRSGGCGMSSGWKPTEAEAIEAWNTRAERTCKNIETSGEGFFTCSACGGGAVIDWTTKNWGKPNYCPNCGAKVVDE